MTVSIRFLGTAAFEIITAEKKRILIDPYLDENMKLYGELYRPTIGLINVGVPTEHRGTDHGVPEYLTGEMDATEAFMACQWLRLNYAIPCHHDNAKLPEIVKFEKLLTDEIQKPPNAPQPVILEPGETFSI